LSPRLWTTRNHSPCRNIERAFTAYRQLGSQICMFQVACEIGKPVRIG
jgi:hypothetical protein